jgi:hypothetical protein
MPRGCPLGCTQSTSDRVSGKRRDDSTSGDIRSSKFPILPSEKEELVNEGMYGKALAVFLQAQRTDRGYDAPFVCCEDWGW